MISITIDGSNVTSHVIAYTREQDICSTEALIELELDTYMSFSTYDIILAYEDSVLKGTFYVEYLEKRSDGSMLIHGRDNSKRARDYFIETQYTVEGDTTSRYWIEIFLGQAGISYNFTTVEGGYTIQEGEILGPGTCADLVENLVRHSGWYIFYDSMNVAQVGKLAYDSTTYVAVFEDDDIISIVHNKNDQYLRNRAVIWGSGYRGTQEWTFADITVPTPWNYDSADVRAILAKAGFPIPHSQAIGTANVLLNEYARLSEEKTVELHGFHDIKVGDFIFIKATYYNRVCLISNLNATATSSGMKTTVVLDRRCPRFVGFYDMGGIVYAGTESDGVWTKPLNGTQVWTNYSTGLTDLNVTDLDASFGVLSCVTDDGSLWGRTVGDAAWRNLLPSSFYDSQSLVTYPATSGNYVACNINDTNQTIYGLYTVSGDSGWRTWVSSFPSVYGSATNLMILTESGNADLRGYDIESTFEELYISTATPRLMSQTYTSFNLFETGIFGLDQPTYTDTVYSGMGLYAANWLSDGFNMYNSNQKIDLVTNEVTTIYDPSGDLMFNCLIDSNTALHIDGNVTKIDLNNHNVEWLKYVAYNPSTKVLVHTYGTSTYVFWMHSDPQAHHWLGIYNYSTNEYSEIQLANEYADAYTPGTQVAYTPSVTVIPCMVWLSKDNRVFFYVIDANNAAKIYNYNIATNTLTYKLLHTSTYGYEGGIAMDRDTGKIMVGLRNYVNIYEPETNTQYALAEPEWNEPQHITLIRIPSWYNSNDRIVFEFEDRAIYVTREGEYSRVYSFRDINKNVIGTKTLTIAEQSSYILHLQKGDDINKCIVSLDIEDINNAKLKGWNIENNTSNDYEIDIFIPESPPGQPAFTIYNGAQCYFEHNKIILTAKRLTSTPTYIQVLYCEPLFYTYNMMEAGKILKHSNNTFTDLLDGSLPFTLDISDPTVITATIGVTNSGVITIEGVDYQIGTSIGNLYFSRTGLPDHFRSINIATMSGSYLYDMRTFNIISGEIGSEEFRTCIGFVRMDSTLSSTGNFSYIDITGLDDIGSTIIFPDIYVMQEFATVPETLETSNYEHWETPYFLVGTRLVSGEVFQRDMDTPDFINRSTGLPDSKITIIRLDDMI